MYDPCPFAPQNKELLALELPIRAYNALRSWKPDVTVAELRGMSEDKLMHIRGMGRKSARAVVESVGEPEPPVVEPGPAAVEAEQVERWVADHKTLILALARGEAIVVPLSDLILSRRTIP